MSTEVAQLEIVSELKGTNVPTLLDKIRPEWQAKNLISRVRRLLQVDPSSACQRLLNAAIHDLRDKVNVVGVDIAGEAAIQHKLPPISRLEDIESYSTSNLINLAYRIGLLTRPEWRRVCRCYEIRRDLEHEDDEYEAGIEDCIYIFNTCIEVVLAVDPVQLLKVTDVKELVGQASSIVPDDALIEDYERAPQPRQEEILRFLISTALNPKETDIVQQNSYTCISYLRSKTQKPVLLKIGTHLQDQVGRSGLNVRSARVATVAGVFPFLRKSARAKFFEEIFDELESIGVRWTEHQHHGELLRSFIEYGSFAHCPDKQKKKILRWLTLTYLGEPGGKTSFGNVRHVFYSNSAAHLIENILREDARLIANDLGAVDVQDSQIT